MTNEREASIETRGLRDDETNDNSNNNNNNNNNNNDDVRRSHQVSSSIRKQAEQSMKNGQHQLPPPITPMRQQVRPARPAHLHHRHPRQVIVATTGATNSGSLIGQPIELASLGAHPVAGGSLGPPKRPAHLPARYDTLTRLVPAPVAINKPNRYSSWAQVQSNWRAAIPGGVRTAVGTDPVGAPHGPQQQHHHHHFSSPFSSAASRVLVVNPMQIVNLSEHTKSRLIKIIEALKRFSEKWFSHVLLLMFLAIYACFGAYIFINFEAPTEQWEKQIIIDTRQRMVNDTWQEAKSKSQMEFLDIFRNKLEDYERLLNRACASGMSSSSLENQWTFWGALFYSMTVFTTIGYGHLTPITFAGRVATMVYAIFGIPILLMVLADLGKLLTRIIKYAFKKFRSLYNQLLHRKTSIRTRKMISDNTNHCIGAARDAFERGYTHIKPYNKFPDALAKVSTLKRKFQLSKTSNKEPEELDDVCGGGCPPEGATGTIQQSDTTTNNTIATNSGDNQAAEAKVTSTPLLETSLDLQQQQSSKLGGPETTDVIVTPALQTKPVSPTIQNRRQSPFDNHGHNTNHHQHHNHHHHQNNHHNNNSQPNQHNHHGRSQSPGFQQSASGNRRKGSLGGLMGSSQRCHKAQGSSQAAAASKGSVSRSSSLSSSQIQSDTNKMTLNGRQQPINANLTEQNNQEPSRVTSGVGTPEISPDCTKQQLETVDHLRQTETIASADHTALEYDEMVGDIGAGVMEDDVVVDDDEEEIEEDEFDIPVSFALFLLVTYMMFGAVVFSIWEGWNFFDSLYFVFISMSTIGFGDLVPQHPKRMIGTFIYLLFGLALTSMCINVVQEKIHATFLRAKMQIGEKMGLDLDQIMADDYYDGSTLECDEDDLNSVANSQTNSSFAYHIQGNGLVAEAGCGGDLLDNNGDNMNNNIAIKPVMVDGQHTIGSEHSTGVKQSRSKDSIRSKRRNMTGLPGHSNSGGGSGGAGSGGLLRRSHSKKLQRQVTPSSMCNAELSNPNHHSHHHHGQSQAQTTSATISPRPEVEIGDGKMQLQAAPITAATIDTAQPPAINQPANEVTQGTCEPLQRMKSFILNGKSTDEENNRTRLIVSNSQPPTTRIVMESNSRIPKSLSSETGFIEIGNGNYGQLRPRRPSTAMAGNSHASNRNLQQQQRHQLPTIGRHRSAESSRRSSVSHELNELDDLLLKLSHCHLADERFGPLLGIPAKGRRHSRPNSANTNHNPMNNDNFTNNTSGQPQVMAKRGTSMINRPSRFQTSASYDKSTTAIASVAALAPAGASGVANKLSTTPRGRELATPARLPVSTRNSNDSQRAAAAATTSDSETVIRFSAV